MLENTLYTERSRKNFWIVLAIYLTIFINTYVFAKQPIDVYIGYVVYLLLLPGFISKFGFNKNLMYIFLILLFAGIINVLAGNNTSLQFLKVYISVLLSYFFYYYVIIELEFNVEQMFKWYLKGCYIAALIGVFQFVSFRVGFNSGAHLFNIFNKWGFSPGGIFGLRVNSVFSEPTHLGSVLSAAFFVAVYNVIRRENYYYSAIQNWTIIVVYLLAFSGMGQIGVFLTILLLAINFGLIRYVIVMIPLMIITFNYLYNNVDEFKERFDSTYGLFVEEQEFELGKTHGSSFILYNNYIVTKENFRSNFLFGTGLGSHPTAFEKYSIAKDIAVEGFNWNSADANSMLLRIVSETGLFGLIIFMVVVVKCYVKRDRNNDSYHWLISNGLLIMILLNLFRQGHYFLYGFPFFFLLYYYNSVKYKEFLIEQENDTRTSEEQLNS